MTQPPCPHSKLRCLNHYDTFRKYLCEECGGVYMCQCEEQLALGFVPHQVRSAQESGTRRRFVVTGFASHVCLECRGKKEEPHPRAAIYKQKGKVQRFYWREIFKTYCQSILEWQSANSEQVKDIFDFQKRFPDVARLLKKEARAYWQQLHKQTPKYNLKEKTQAEFLSGIKIPVVRVMARYCQVEKSGQKIGKWLNQAGELVSAESIAAEYYEHQGYVALRCERKLISTLISTFLTRSVQSSSDPRVKEVFRNTTRGWTPNNTRTGLISILLPEDFGSVEHYARRQKEIQEDIDQMRKCTNLLTLFDQLVHPSTSLRDYLWVNDDRFVELARTALAVLPTEVVIAGVEWTIGDFWHRQPGWPDFLVYNNDEFLFSEVKSPKNELSREQMNWFEWAIGTAKIPSELCRVENQKA